MSGSILFFYFAEEAMKDRELSNEKLPQCAVALQFFGKLIQI